MSTGRDPHGSQSNAGWGVSDEEEAMASQQHDPLARAPVVTSISDEAVDAAEGSGGDYDDDGAPGAVRRLLTLPQLMGLFACSFSYAFIFNTINNIVIPKEIERLASSRQSIWVGAIMGAGAISQLATPVVGAASDRSGVRTNYLIYGSLTTVVGVVLFMATVSVNDLLLLFCAHVVTSVGLSMQYSMVTALLNDHVVEEQVGKGSGTMAILAICVGALSRRGSPCLTSAVCSRRNSLISSSRLITLPPLAVWNGYPRDTSTKLRPA
jgi:hypothetical protein